MSDPEIRELENAIDRIWEKALDLGLDPFPVHFEVVPATVMYEIGSYALPGRYSHWSFGKAYYKMKMLYDLGLSRIYEVVINTNPAYAFLLEGNSLTQNKMIIAHVLAHVDFFKNNVYFSRTNRRMVDEVSTHADRIREYEFTYGRKTVEEFLDAVLSIQEHIDFDFFIRRKKAPSEEEEKRPPKRPPAPGKYDDLLRLGEPPEAKREEEDAHPRRDPPEPEKDLVYYIMKNSPVLQPWQRDIMAMMHEEMEYFVPQLQTKVMNEGWACATGDALILTEKGFLRFDELYRSRSRIGVASGGQGRVFRITDFHKQEKVPTIRLRTRRGLTIEGALQHRILRADGRWADLKDLKVGDRILLETGTDLWPKVKQRLNFSPTRSTATLTQVAALAGVSLGTVIRYRKGERTRCGDKIRAAMKIVSYRPGRIGKILPTRVPLRTRRFLDEDIAWLLGYFIGDGKRVKSGICFTSGEEDLCRRLERAVQVSFGLRPIVRWDPTKSGGRWRVIVHSRELLAFLQSLGIDLQAKARAKKIPPIILRSPKSVVSAFLRGYFDADASAGREGIRLSSASEELIRTVQIILLNYGILSTQRRCQDGCVRLEITGASAARFFHEIGFSLARKQRALQKYVEQHHWFKEEDQTDVIVSLEDGCADVFDITVDTEHTYVANGFINHNSFWHSRIMRELDLTDQEYLDFAELHAAVVSPRKGSLNPYYIGYRIFEDIERRWNNPTEEEQKKFGRLPGAGRAKIFEVRELENDVSFIRNYLTKELVEDLDLYLYELRDEEEWVITDKNWERVRDQIVADMTNLGFPYIEVYDGDYNGNRELYLRHRYEGVELDLEYAQKTLEYVYKLWGRDVHLETVVDGETLVMHYDGEEHWED